MKKTLLAIILCGILITSFAGCGGKKESADTETAASTVSDTADVTSGETKMKISDDITAEPTHPTDIESTETVLKEDREKDTQTELKPTATATATAKAPAEKKPTQKPTVETQKTESKPAKTQETVTPKESTPPETTAPNPPAETEKPKENPQSEPIKEQKFDIDYWITYAKSYAQSIGLTLDKTATDCWDNPITANAKRKSIQTDIVGRLNRYKNVEEFTSVWIWAEKITETEYDIYIGYA